MRLIDEKETWRRINRLRTVYKYVVTRYRNKNDVRVSVKLGNYGKGIYTNWEFKIMVTKRWWLPYNEWECFIFERSKQLINQLAKKKEILLKPRFTWPIHQLTDRIGRIDCQKLKWKFPRRVSSWKERNKRSKKFERKRFTSCVEWNVMLQRMTQTVTGKNLF